MRSIAKMGGIFALFNMNEIVLFGFPVRMKLCCSAFL